MTEFLRIEQILAVARKHPFYSSNVYPPTLEEVARIEQDTDIKGPGSKSYFFKIYQKAAGNLLASEPALWDVDSMLSKFPILEKEDLYKTLLRLYSDNSPLNTFRYSTYISSSGGGGGVSSPLAFLTDTQENRAQRAACGHLLRRCGMISKSDCALIMHTSGKLYRALDLITDLIEYAGGSGLPVGHLATPEELMEIAKNFKPNVLCGDTSQLVGFASYLESTGGSADLKITKVCYTSEVMTKEQRQYLGSIFGQNDGSLSIISVLGSAETGCWAVSNPEITGSPTDDSADFIFDTRQIIVEVLPQDFRASKETKNYPYSSKLNEIGPLVVTSLQRLRHPLVRYLNGDIGSVHELPPTAIPFIKEDPEYLRILRLYGRNLHYSFKWFGEYFEFSRLKELMSNPDWGILRWQIVTFKHPTDTKVDCLEVKLMRRAARDDEGKMLVSWEELLLCLERHFCVDAANKSLFNVVLASSKDFVYSKTGNKVIMFVDRRK